MERVPVESSNLVSVGYDENSLTLEIEFKSGIYQYYDVPQYIYEELISSSSLGSYHHRSIKNEFSCSKV
ncbi:KTSC domain-containing protein [Pseudoalteromonas lipolytica]|uniref:KTSC domain-containing protein n=1 Tax=Pseudoalteromonas lipolytica TaxID=570156 RepID=A0ABY1GCJ6_9GAMM|nr:KTSC domain-containing protein [Pseudoalteromonas lipolytica]